MLHIYKMFMLNEKHPEGEGGEGGEAGEGAKCVRGFRACARCGEMLPPSGAHRARS